MDAKNRGWHINGTLSHNNQAWDGKAKYRVVTKASIGNQWHDVRAHHATVKKYKATLTQNNPFHESVMVDRAGKDI